MSHAGDHEPQKFWRKIDFRTIFTVFVVVVIAAGFFLQLRGLRERPQAPHFVQVTDAKGLKVRCVVFGAGTGSCDWGNQLEHPTTSPTATTLQP